MSRRAVVIGAGVNGLVAAQYLSRAGYQVVVLERRERPDASPDVGWIPPRIVRELGLERRGLRVRAPDPWIAVPLPQGGKLELWRDVPRSVEAIRRLSVKDAARWPAFCDRMARLTRFLERLYTAPPPDLMTRDLWGLLNLARLGGRVRRLGRQGIVDLLRTLPMSVGELLDDWFESDALKGALAAAGVLHLRQGPRSGGTAFLLLHHSVGNPPGVFRPSRSNLRDALSGLGGIEVRGGADVTGIAVRDGRVTGIVLKSGEELPTSLVVSGIDPRRTLLDLVGPSWLDPETVRALRHIKCRGVAALVTLTLDRNAGFTRLAVSPSIDYLERAYDDAKYGRVSAAPYVEALAHDSQVEVHVQYAPYALREGSWDDARRRALGDQTLRVLSDYAPSLRDAVRDQVVLAPPDLERELGLPEGHAYHGELTLDQILFMRPVPGWARYRTPIQGLFLCGPGTHPGGAIAGAAGANAARVIKQVEAGRS